MDLKNKIQYQQLKIKITNKKKNENILKKLKNNYLCENNVKFIFFLLKNIKYKPIFVYSLKKNNNISLPQYFYNNFIK